MSWTNFRNSFFYLIKHSTTIAAFLAPGRKIPPKILWKLFSLKASGYSFLKEKKKKKRIKASLKLNIIKQKEAVILKEVPLGSLWMWNK